MKVIKIERPEAGSYWIGLSKEQAQAKNSFLAEEIELMFTEDETGDFMKITLVEVTDDEFDKIQNTEFPGW